MSRKEYVVHFLEIIYLREKIYFVDESGVSCSMRRIMGRSLKWTRAVLQVPNLRKKNFLIAAVFNINGMPMFEIRDCAYNAIRYLDFINAILFELE